MKGFAAVTPLERFSVLFCPHFSAAAINLSHLFLETLSFLWYDFFVFTNPKTGEKCACLVDGAAKHVYRYVQCRQSGDYIFKST